MKKRLFALVLALAMLCVATPFGVFAGSDNEIGYGDLSDCKGNHTWDEGTVTTPATCGAAGVKTFTCTECGTTKTEEIPATGEHSWDEGAVTTPATCGAAGVKTFTCAVCKTTKTEEIPATGEHNWDEGTVTTPATCTEPGEKTLTCSVCQETKTEPINALGHDWEEEWTIDVPATETMDGSKSHHCTRCDEKTDVTVIPKTGPVRTGWYTDPDTGLTYYYNEDGTLYTQELLELPNPEDPNTSLYYHFYPQYATVNGKNVEYSRLLGWVKMPGGIIRYYEEGARWFKTGFQYVGEERYFFDFYSGAQYIPPEEEWYQGMGWYVFTDPDTKIPSYYALDPENGGCFVYGLYTNSKGETYYFPLYQLGYATGFVTVDGETYYFDPATGIRVENETRTIGAATLTFGADGKVTKAVGLYLNKLYDADGNLVTEKGLVRGADGNLYYTTGNGDLYTSYWWNIDYRDESGSKKIYMLKGKVLEGLVTLTEEDLKITYNGEFLHEDLTVAGTYLFAGNSTEALTGFQTAENGLEYFFQPKKGGARYESWTFAGLTQPDDSTVLANFYGKGSVIDGVDYSFAHKVGLIKDTDGNLYYYEDGTEGPIKGKTVTVDGVQYELDATTGVASRVG